jgi:nucleotide-binding universal stress UspA family protein
MFECIVYATDGSEHARKALQHVHNIAKLNQSVVYLVHVYPSVSDFIGYEEYDRILARRIAKGRGVLEEPEQKLKSAGIDCRSELIEGPIGEAIIKVAETRVSDLIVLGARGLSSLEGLLLGSVSQKVIQHSHCPVLVVR